MRLYKTGIEQMDQSLDVGDGTPLLMVVSRQLGDSSLDMRTLLCNHS